MVYVFDRLSHGVEGPGAAKEPDSVGAIYLKVHHCVADGVGFQNIVGLLTDPTPDPAYDVSPRTADEKAPTAALWMARSAARFRREARLKQAQSAQRSAARAAYRAFRADPANKRAPTPELQLAQKTGQQRRYLPLSLPLDRVRAAGKRLGGSVNDAFLACAAGALRRYLIDVNDLPDQPLVAVAARSYRKPEHGLFGNPHHHAQPKHPCATGGPRRALQGNPALHGHRGRARQAHAAPDQRIRYPLRRQETLRRLRQAHRRGAGGDRRQHHAVQRAGSCRTGPSGGCPHVDQLPHTHPRQRAIPERHPAPLLQAPRPGES